MTSATELLRRLLDERGVEWVDTGDGSTLIPAQTATNVAWDVNTWPSGKDMGDCLWVQNIHPLTPEQAIAATLGSERETCHGESDLSEWVCSNCQCWIPLGLTPENIKYASEWRFCPHCGAKVEVDA